MPKQEQKSSIADYYEDKEKSDSKNISMQKNPMHSKESKPSQQPTINNSQFLNDDEDAKNRKNNTNKLATLIISYGPKSNPLSRKKLSKPKENAQANINIEPNIQTPPTSQSKLDKQTTSLVKSIIAESGEKIANAELNKINNQNEEQIYSYAYKQQNDFIDSNPLRSQKKQTSSLSNKEEKQSEVNNERIESLKKNFGPKSNPIRLRPKPNKQTQIASEASIQEIKEKPQDQLRQNPIQQPIDKPTPGHVERIKKEFGEKIAEAEKTKANLQVAQEKFKEPTIQKYVQSDKISTAEKDKVSKESKRSNIDFSKRDFEAELKKARELEEKTREKFEKSRETLEELKKKEKEKNFTKEEKDSLNKLKGLEKTYEIRQAITKSKEKLLNKSKSIDVDKMREGLIDRSDNVNSNPIVIKGQAQENYRGR